MTIDDDMVDVADSQIVAQTIMETGNAVSTPSTTIVIEDLQLTIRVYRDPARRN